MTLATTLIHLLHNLVYSALGLIGANRKAADPLLTLFSKSRAEGRRNRIAFNWDQYGVGSPYVIFITGRCGSTLLSNLIKDTHLAGAPEEYFNEDFVASINKDASEHTLMSYLRHVVEKDSVRGSFGLEIDWFRLRQLLSAIDFLAVFPSKMTTFFYMTRRDIVEQAWSFATAKATGVWQHYSDEQIEMSPRDVPDLVDQIIWSEIMLLLEAEMQMEGFFSRNKIKPIRIDYEGLITSKKNTLALVLLNIGCDIESIAGKVDQVKDRNLKMPDKNFENMLAFRAKYRDLLFEVENSRGSNYTSLRYKLKLMGLAC
jgi:LPS sulfotransferase NodH